MKTVAELEQYLEGDTEHFQKITDKFIDTLIDDGWKIEYCPLKYSQTLRRVIWNNEYIINTYNNHREATFQIRHRDKAPFIQNRNIEDDSYEMILERLSERLR